jgi:outer membrane protein TolC
LLLAAALVGCSHPCFMSESDFNQCRTTPLPSGPPAGDCAGRPDAVFAPVTTVNNPEGERRPISLYECVAIALEKGRVGGTSVRVLAYNPAIAQTTVEQSLAQFDAHFRATTLWETIDEKAGGTPLLNPATLLGVIATATNQLEVLQSQRGLLQTQLLKPLPTGGIAGITFQTDYEFNNLGAVEQFNPSYLSRLVFTFEQPLLRGAGVEVNQTGILVSRVAVDQAHTAFAGSVNDLLFSVEQAYWTLYSSYWNLYTQDVALRQSHAAWQVTKALFDKGQAKVQDVALLEETYQGFRLGRLDAVQAVLEAERQLRLVVGLPPEDGCRLIPADQPSAAPFRPDWQTALGDALENRPELVQLRQDLTRLQVEIRQAKNQILPDLRFVGSYDLNGLGNRLDGPDENLNALRTLASDRFNNWSLGLQLDVPIGARAAHAQLRRAELALAQRQDQLHDQEAQAAFALQRSYRELLLRYERVKVVSALRRAATTQYLALYEEFRRGLGTLQFFLGAQQSWLAAMREEQLGILQYNIALAEFEREKGTLTRFDNVAIAEGPLPACVQERASEHIRQREAALRLRKRAAPVGPEAGPGGAGCPAETIGLEPLLTNGPPSVPALLEQSSRLPDLPDTSAAGTVNASPYAQTDAQRQAKP